MRAMATAAHALPQRRRSVFAALATLLGLVVATVAGQARANSGLCIDAAGFALVAVGVALWFGSGAGVVAAGVGILLLRDFGGDSTTRP